MCREQHQLSVVIVLSLCKVSWYCVCQLGASFTSFRQLLRCANKRIVNLMKVYIESSNMHVELIRFVKKISTLFTFSFPNRGMHCNIAHRTQFERAAAARKCLLPYD